MSDHRHEWAVGRDCYYCTVDGCHAELSSAHPDLSAVVVCNDEERRAVERALRELRNPPANQAVPVHVTVYGVDRHCPACGYPVGAP